MFLNVKVGDIVIRHTRHSESLHKVVKVTPSGMIDIQISDGYVERFNKDGSLRGNGANVWHLVYITLASAEDFKRIKNKKEKMKLVDYLTRLDYKNFELVKLRKLYELANAESYEEV